MRWTSGTGVRRLWQRGDVWKPSWRLYNGGMAQPVKSDGRAAGGATELRRPSPRALALFRMYARWYMRRHFHAIRVANAQRIPQHAERLIVFGNHASWWDPLTALLLAEAVLPGREHYAPMDETALKNYAIFKPMGFFPVENGTARGAVQLLRAGEEIFERGGALWITPESQFQDVRTRPVTFKQGLGKLMTRQGRMKCVPLGIEYTFWDERLPEVLINIGEPLEIADGTMEETQTWTNLLSYAMAATLDELALLAEARDPGGFIAILEGGGGIGGVYELWQRVKAAVTGREYHHNHGSLHKR